MSSQIKIFPPFPFNPNRRDKIQDFISSVGLTYEKIERTSLGECVVICVTETLTQPQKDTVRARAKALTDPMDKTIFFDDEDEFNDESL